MKNTLKKGDRIRLNVRTMTGWKGCGTVTRDQCCNLVAFRPDGRTTDLGFDSHAMRNEVTKLKPR